MCVCVRVCLFGWGGHLRLRLGRLAHEGADDGPRHGGGVEAVVEEALGDVHRIDAAAVLKRPQVQDELVRDAPLGAGKEQVVVVLEPLRHVVGVEDRQLRRPLQAPRPHHLDVHPRDGQDRRAAPRRRRHRAHGARAAGADHGVAREEGRQLGVDADGAHAGAAAAVGDAERLVQVEVAHVGADAARRGVAHLRAAGGSQCARAARAHDEA